MSDSEHSTMSYASISSYSDPSASDITLMDADKVPEMDPYKEIAQQGQVAPPLSPAYVPDHMEPEDHVPVYVSEPAYPEYLVPSEANIPVEDQPLPDDASPVALSPGYIADSDPKEDEEDPAHYLVDGGDDDDESSDDKSFDDESSDDESSDDDDDDDDDDVEEDEEEEGEHLLLLTLFLLLL
ncbi:hypothetical protein Tco_1239222 [Tanacetum coccineum]